MSGFTTPEQDRRYHAVADRFDRPTRRRVQRAVAKGEPPLDEDLRPLALLYLERQEKDAADTKRWLPWLWIGLGLINVTLATVAWIIGSLDITTIPFMISGLCYVTLGLIEPRTQRERTPRLERSHDLLLGEPS
jgi:hypothetical protein